MSDDKQHPQSPSVQISQTEDGTFYMSGVGVGISNEWAEQRAKAAGEAEQRLQRIEQQLLGLQTAEASRNGAELIVQRRLAMLEQTMEDFRTVAASMQAQATLIRASMGEMGQQIRRVEMQLPDTGLCSRIG